MTRKIQFGFWNYIESGVFGKGAVQEWKDMHCTLPMSFNYDHVRDNKQDMLDILDENEIYIRTVQLVMEHAPGLIPFANLVPYWGGGSDFDMYASAHADVHTKLAVQF